MFFTEGQKINICFKSFMTYPELKKFNHLCQC